MSNLEQLYRTLDERKRPEDVAEMIVVLLGDGLTVNEKKNLERVAQGSLSKKIGGYTSTSMLQTFASAKGAGQQIEKAIELFQLDTHVQSDYNRADDIEAFIGLASSIIHKPVGQNDFTVDRLNKVQRAANNLDLSKRNYNKKWRLLKRIEKKLQTFIRESRKISFQKAGKHGLAGMISLEDFSADPDTACFIAYYNARCNLRSVFTNQSQDRPYDEICDLLLNRCRRQPDRTNWWAIAHLYTSAEVLSRLSEGQKGLLLGKWTSLLEDIATLLDEVWQSSRINLQTMVVKRGDDSTTWNNTAAAWNKARDHWMHLVYASGMEAVLDDICFGKVLRLMAADVVAWHAAGGGKLDPNTAVWNKLPLPWEVFRGKASCTKEQVTRYCRDAGLDPEKSGWIAPRVHGVTAFRPTPELVHGVAIANPFLATVLKQQKYFSGKGLKQPDPGTNPVG